MRYYYRDVLTHSFKIWRIITLQNELTETIMETKIHMLDMFQILEAFDKYRGSVERLEKQLKEHSAKHFIRFNEVL